MHTIFVVSSSAAIVLICVCYRRYMTRLEEHYLGLYLDGSKRAVGAADREALAQRLLREFSSAAAAALPNAEVG